MPDNYFPYYAEANLVCVILICIILFHDIRKVSRQEKQVLFDYALLAHALYFVSDACWAAVVAGVLPRTRALVLAFNLSNYILLSSIAFFWFFFAVESIGMPLWRDRRKNRRRMGLIQLPLLGMLAVMIVAYLIAPNFWISPDGELNQAYYPMFITAPVIYIIMSLVCALKQARKRENAVNRWFFILIGVYPVSMAFFGIVQLRCPSIPMFCFGLTIMMTFFYIQSMEDRVSLDAMTGLNNRGQLMRYLSQPSNLHREGLRTYVIMADANAFKQINDTYGHAEGDHAIILISDALKASVGILSNSAFLARYGGDEFILVAYVREEAEIGTLAAEIRRQLDDACRENETPYRLSLGLGWAEFIEREETFQECLKRADRKLYLDKEREKAKNARVSA